MMRQRWFRGQGIRWAIAYAIGCNVALGGCAQDPTATTTTQPATVTTSKLAQIQQRGHLICGVNGELPGFSYVDGNGNYSGLDVDFCRAIAAAIFDDPNAVTFRNLNVQERLAALQQNQVDVLSRNTTVTLSRDTSDGLAFGPILFYDGQGILVSQASGIQQLSDLKDQAICVQANTTSELNLADQMRQRQIPYQPVVFDSADAMYTAYAEGRCAGATSDRSQLLVQRKNLPNPADHTLLPDVLSKEPLAPVVTDEDARWLATITWIAYVLIEAEELGITQKNLPKFLDSKDPHIRRFLGIEDQLGQNLELPKDFASRVLKHVGNYSEIYDRNLGQPFGLERGLNALWTKNGLLYAPPFR